MGEWIEIAADDGFGFGCYTAAPAGAPKGGILVIQEIFGVNAHIREVADGYAADGYLAWAPSVYDRVERRFECGYTPEDIAKARDIMAAAPFDRAVQDMAAARSRGSGPRARAGSARSAIAGAGPPPSWSPPASGWTPASATMAGRSCPARTRWRRTP